MLDRLARGRPVRTAAFFGACGVYFCASSGSPSSIGAAYWVLFAWLHPFLFGTLYDRLTRDLIDGAQRAADARRAVPRVRWPRLMLVSLVADFAKVRAVVEDRRSMLGALGASTAFRPPTAAARARPVLLNAARLCSSSCGSGCDRAGSCGAGLVGVARRRRSTCSSASGPSSPSWRPKSCSSRASWRTPTTPPLPEPLWPDSPAAEAIENRARQQ